MTPVDLVHRRGLQARAPCQARDPPPARSASRCSARDDPDIVAVAERRADRRPCRAAARRSTMSRRSPTSSSPIAGSRPAPAIAAMAQLSDDCFAFGGALMSGAEALDASCAADLAAARRPRPCRSSEALGPRPRRALVAPRDVPPHDNAAVDGYAVHFDDLDADGDDRAAGGRPRRGRPSAATRAARRGDGDPHLHRRADARRGRTPC